MLTFHSLGDMDVVDRAKVGPLEVETRWHADTVPEQRIMLTERRRSNGLVKAAVGVGIGLAVFGVAYNVLKRE